MNRFDFRHANRRLNLLLGVLLFGAVIITAPDIAQAKRKGGAIAVGDNEVAGGFGFQVGFSDWAPGGFKWFNDYSRNLSDHVWLNVQLNAVIGNMRDDHCWYDEVRDQWRCDGGRWDGNAIELAVGPKLRFPLTKLPMIIDAKLGGTFETLFFSSDYAGVGLAFRGGVGVHYYLFDNLGIGPEVMFNMGAAFISDVGARFYATFDFQVIGVQYRW